MSANRTVRVVPSATQGAIEALYARVHRREFVEPDPLQHLYAFEELTAREAAALVAASLAFGNVKTIVRNAAGALERAGLTRPSRRILPPRDLPAAFAGFRHRWVAGDEVAALLLGVRRLQKRHGSLLAAFSKGLQQSDATVVPALIAFVRELSRAAEGGCPSLIASPADGSACKRMFLFLRWMVRHDDVDPGGWEPIGAYRLVMPLDVHVHRITLRLGFTDRRHASLAAAVEITDAFRALDPEDPVKYDFALSRLGFNRNADARDFFARCRLKEDRT